jgi:hypothetical protein
MPPRRASLAPSRAASKRLSYADTLCVAWFALDAFTHLVIELSYLLLALGPTAAKSPTLFGAIWREYGRADSRWARRDATVISLELLTVFIGGPAAAALVFAILKCACHMQPANRACADSALQGQAVAPRAAGDAQRGGAVRRLDDVRAGMGRRLA